MKLDRQTVDQVAALACLGLSDEERERLEKQLEVILEHVGILNDLSIDGVPPSPHAVALSHVVREDEPMASLPEERRRRLGPPPSQGFFKAPRILEEAS